MIEHRTPSTPGILCSHSVRAGPRSKYADRPSALTVTRSHLLPTRRRNRQSHAAPSEIPTTSSNTALSRCHPTVPIYHRPPSHPYHVLGYLDATTAPIRRHDVLPYCASRVKEFGGDALIVLSEGAEYAGTFTNGSANTTGSMTANHFYPNTTDYNFNANTSYSSTAYPMFKGRATVLVIKFSP